MSIEYEALKRVAERARIEDTRSIRDMVKEVRTTNERVNIVMEVISHYVKHDDDIDEDVQRCNWTKIKDSDIDRYMFDTTYGTDKYMYQGRAQETIQSAILDRVRGCITKEEVKGVIYFVGGTFERPTHLDSNMTMAQLYEMKLETPSIRFFFELKKPRVFVLVPVDEFVVASPLPPSYQQA